MSLEEKLAAIDKAVKEGQAEFNRKNGRPIDTPIDPADLTQCDGCQ